MNTLQEFRFKRRKPKPHLVPVCQVIICCKDSGRVERKLFTSWDRAREYVNERSVKGRKVRINIERI